MLSLVFENIIRLLKDFTKRTTIPDVEFFSTPFLNMLDTLVCNDNLFYPYIIRYALVYFPIIFSTVCTSTFPLSSDTFIVSDCGTSATVFLVCVAIEN